MPEHFAKTNIARAAGIELPQSSVPANEGIEKGIGKEIQRRAAYGRITVEAVQTYLSELQRTGIVSLSALAANLSTSSIQRLRRIDPDFAEEESRARELFVAEVIDAPFRKWGLEGVHRIIIDKNGTRHKGERVIQPQIALAFARKFDPAYREKQELDVNHSGGVVLVTAPMGQTDDDLERYARKVESEKRDVIDVEAKVVDDASAAE